MQTRLKIGSCGKSRYNALHRQEYDDVKMARIARISRLLPKTFADGTKVRRFAKHCPRCRHFVEATDMEGMLAMLDNRLFLSAHARCPRCAARFGLGCMITQDKRVHPVRLPLWMFRMWLRYVLRKAVDIEEPSQDWQYGQEEAPAVARPADSELAFSESVIGRFQGQDIPASCEYRSQPYRFERVVPAGLPVNADEQEILVRNLFIYRLAPVNE